MHVPAPRGTRLRRALTAGVVGVVACAVLFGPVLFFGSVALRSTLTDLNARAVTERDSTVSLAAKLIGRSMAGRADQLRDLASRVTLRSALAARDQAALTRILDVSRSGHPETTIAAAFDPAGVMLARSPDAAVVGQSFADREYMQGALLTATPYVGDAVIARATGRASIVLALAVRDGSSVIGVLNLAVEPGVLIDDLQTSLEREGREIVLVDHAGQTLASTQAREPLGRLGLAPAPDGTAAVDGVTKVVAMTAVPGTTWTLYAIDDPSVIFAQQRAALSELGAPLFWAIVASGLLAALLSIVFLLLRRERAELADANARLLAMNSEVEAATHAKSDFLASMSHELRTPLNAVLGFSDVLAEQLGDTLTDRQRRYLDNIHAAGSHLLELINDVLDLSKVEAGRLQLRPEPIPLSDLLEPVVASAGQLAADRGVRFEPEPIPSGVAQVDAARVRQVLLNLLSNAVKFTPKGGLVTLRVTTTGRALGAEVSDTGIGISAEQRGRVFGMFERLHEGRSEATGTGLGLAITKRLVELHGGTIDFEREPGTVPRFWFWIPGVIVEPQIGPRVLVVEDDTRDADLLAELARESGQRVEVAPTAASAMQSIARSAPSAVILDLRLPDRRGDEVLVALKTDPRTARIPVLVVTVEDDDGGARVLGADDHMTKPIQTERVRAWLRKTAGGVASARAAG